MFALNILAGNWTTPEFRAVVEQMPPAEYLATSYYEHWLFQFERYCEQQGWCSREDLRPRTGAASSSAPLASNVPVRADQVVRMLLKGGGSRAKVATPPRFSVGDRVRLRRDNPPTHTRLPNYVRGCAGTVATAAHGGFAFADAQAQHLYDVAEHLYTVRFEATEVWGRNAEVGCALYLDLYESYMERP
jgi:nitrile hydratase